MEERLKRVYEDICWLLSNAPDEDECSFEENDMYDDMQNLKESMEVADYENLYSRTK